MWRYKHQLIQGSCFYMIKVLTKFFYCDHYSLPADLISFFWSLRKTPPKSYTWKTPKIHTSSYLQTIEWLFIEGFFLHTNLGYIYEHLEAAYIYRFVSQSWDRHTLHTKFYLSHIKRFGGISLLLLKLEKQRKSYLSLLLFPGWIASV